MNRALLLAGLAVGGYCAYRALKPRYDFRGKHVLITGGSRGLGLCLAREVAARGANVSICARDDEELDRAAEELRAKGARVTTIVADLTQPAEVKRMVAEARAGRGPIDVLIHNAGVIHVGPLTEMTEDDFHESLNLHFWASYHAVMAALPDLKSRRGRVVNISSFGGKIAVPHMVPYAVGKFALVGFSDGLRVELKKAGVVVTTVCPGLVMTGSHLQAQFKGRHEEEYAWFAAGAGTPGFSMNATTAARRIVEASAIGDAELVLGLPAKLGVALRNFAPNLTAELSTVVDSHILPSPGGIGQRRMSGHDSRGELPEIVTTLADRAAAKHNQLQR